MDVLIVRTGPSGWAGVAKTIRCEDMGVLIDKKQYMMGTYAVVAGNRVIGHFTKSNEFFKFEEAIYIPVR